MSIAQRIGEEEYQRIVVSDPEHKWELYDGQLREKPGATWVHGNVTSELSYLLQNQLDRRKFRVSVNSWRVRSAPGSIYIPDIFMVPAKFGDAFRGKPDVLAIFSDPLPLVVEVGSRAGRGYNVEAKIPEYQRRGDLEIWLIHPKKRTLTSWLRLADGSYSEEIYDDDIVSPAALPAVLVSIASLFDV